MIGATWWQWAGAVALFLLILVGGVAFLRGVSGSSPKERIDPEDVADSYPDVPLLGFTNHTDTAGLRRAHAAGFDHVVVKAVLEERARELVEELSASVE